MKVLSSHSLKPLKYSILDSNPTGADSDWHWGVVQIVPHGGEQRAAQEKECDALAFQ